VYSTDLAYIHDAAFRGLTEGAASAIIRLLRDHGIRSGRIVEAGCGSGILARRLVDAGYDVIGFDASPAMIRLARANVRGASRAVEARSAKAAFRVASLERVRMPRCAAVIAIGEVITYARSLRPFFRRVSTAVRAGGLFIFDFIESADRRTYPRRSRAGADWAIVSQANVNRAGTILTRRITTFRKIGGTPNPERRTRNQERRTPGYRRSHEVHRVRIYRRDELARMLTDAGFRFTMRRSYGSYRLLPGDVAVVAERQ
jgi:SAM-dependent methyltransferase